MSSRPGFGRGRGRGGLSGGMIQFIKSNDTLPGEIKSQSTGGSEAKCFPDQNSLLDNPGQNNGMNDTKSSVTSPKSLLSLPTAPSRIFHNSGSDRSRGSDRGRGGGSFRGGGSSRFDNQRQSRFDAPCSRNDRSQLSRDQYFRLWKSEKDPILVKFRKLAHEIVSLTTSRPNAIDKIMSACNRVPMRVEFNTEPVTSNFKQTAPKYMCFVYMDGVFVSTGQGLKLKDSKLQAYEQALDNVLNEFLRVVKVDPTAKELETSSRQFTRDPPEPSKVPLPANTSLIPPSRRVNNDTRGGGPTGSSASSSAKRNFADKGVSSAMKESNLDVATMKRRHNEYKPVEDFVIVEPLVPIQDCTPAHTIRRSADFNHMLLEYEYFYKNGPNGMGCICKLENVPLANVRGSTKIDAKNSAAEVALNKLREICWIIKTKQACDSDVKISKEEMLNEMNEQSAEIKKDNVGHKMLSKMGWTGGGVGKDGTGIATPVELQSTLNRQGLGLSSSKGITDDFRKKVREMIEEYVASGKQDDLVFNCEFRMDERMIIHDECRKFNLKSKSKGKGKNRYLVARRKRSAFELFDMIISCGGETARYKIVPPENHPQGQGGGRPGPSQGGGGNFSQQPQSSSNFGSGGNQGNTPKWNNKNAKLFNNDSSSGGRFDRSSDNGSNNGSFEVGNGGGRFGNNSRNQNQSVGNSQQNFGNHQGHGNMQGGFGGAQNNFDAGQNSYGGGNNNMGGGQNSFEGGQGNRVGAQNSYRGGQNNFNNGGQSNMGGGQNNMDYGGGQNNMDYGGGQSNMGDGLNNMGDGLNNMGGGQNNRGGGQNNMGGGQNNMGYGGGQNNLNWGQNSIGGSQNNMGGSQNNMGGNQNNESNNYSQWQQNGQFQGQGSQNRGGGGQSGSW